MPKRILVVDDDSDDQLLFCEALKDVKSNVECSLAYNGQEALDLIITPPPFDMIFLDLNMPVMDGYETLIILKGDTRFKHIPVIIISTSKHEKDIARCKQLGAHAYFSKPSNYEQLKDGIKSILSTNN